MRTSSSCCHISDFSISFVLYVGCWDRQEVRKHRERAWRCRWRARSGGRGDSTVWVLCWILSVMWFSCLSIEIHFSKIIHNKQNSKWYVSCTSHTCMQGLLEIVLSLKILFYCAHCIAKWGLNLQWLIGQPEIKLCKYIAAKQLFSMFILFNSGSQCYTFHADDKFRWEER